ISWSGQDEANGSDIASYDLYAVVDGGTPIPMATALTGTSTTAHVNPGHTYGFFTLARDNVGHVEQPPSVPDAVTTVRSALQVDAGPDQTAEQRGLVALKGASYTYNGVPTDLALTVDWGDGTTEPGVLVRGTGGGGTISNTHRYTRAGTFV